MNNFGIWYFIIAAIVWVVISFYFVRGKVFNLFDDVLGPAFIIAVLWPLLAVLLFIVVIFTTACLPLYFVCVATIYLIKKKIIK